MAKRKNDDVELGVDSIFDGDEKNESFGFRDLSSEDSINDWLDTGVYVLNGIISGRMVDGGVPNGRLVEIYGESQTGKSFFLKRIAKSAQDKGYCVLYIDTENAETKEGFTRLGINVDDKNKFRLYNMSMIDDVQTSISKWCAGIAKVNSSRKEEDKFKAIIILDSVGMLQSKSEQENSEKGEYSQDMGRRAKDIGRLMRAMNASAMQANVAIIFSNHTYDSMSPFASKTFKQSGGGKKVAYVTSVSLQLTSTVDRDETDDAASVSTIAYGQNVRCIVKKSRFVIPFLESLVHIDFRNGLSRYSGLLDMAIRIGYIKRDGLKYVLQDGTSIGKASNFDNEEFWSQHIDKIDAIFKSSCSYSCVAPEIPGLSERIEEIDNSENGAVEND